MNRNLLIVFILIAWVVSGFYSFDLMKGDRVIGSVLMWHAYLAPTQLYKFIISHIGFSVMVGGLTALGISAIKSTHNQQLKAGDSE